MKDLHRRIGNSYDVWLAAAPDSYKNDGFFPGRRPVAITSRYGQNQPIGCSENDQDVEDKNWDDARCWADISHVTVAVATHIQ